MEWKREVNTNLGITIILVFAALFTIVDFYVVCSHIDGYPFNELSGNTVEDKKVIDEEFIVRDDYILLYDKDGIKIEYNRKGEDGSEYRPRIIFNGTGVVLDGVLQKLKILDDNYLFAVYGGPSGDSHPASFSIFDLYGNSITDVNKLSLDSSLNVLYADMSNNIITYHGSPFNSNVEYFCKGLINKGAQQEEYDDYYNRLYYVKETYTYIGNGMISKTNRVEKTVLDYMKENFGYDNCQDAIENVDSWRDKDIYNLFK